VDGKVADAWPVFTEFLEHPDPQIAGLSRNNLAWGAFIERKPERLEDALAFSEAAASMLPNSAAVQGTRGAVLYWAGRHEEAAQHSRKAFGSSDEPQTKAFSACVLAMIARLSGDRAEAEKWLSLAETLDHRSPLLNEARDSARRDDGSERV
jgi:tetratricopeptide (TPR) repeat protein